MALGRAESWQAPRQFHLQRPQRITFMPNARITLKRIRNVHDDFISGFIGNKFRNYPPSITS
ncbi:hypothetical protein ACFLTP_02925 [Chloroflexota bacterium]